MVEEYGIGVGVLTWGIRVAPTFPNSPFPAYLEDIFRGCIEIVPSVLWVVSRSSMRTGYKGRRDKNTQEWYCGRHHRIQSQH